MALSANRNLVDQDGKLLSLKIEESTHIFKGALLGINAAGYAVAAGAGAGTQFAGVAIEEVNNTGADGADSVLVAQEGAFELPGSGFAQSDVGSTVYASGDDVVTVTEGTTSKQIVGKIVKFISSTKVLVKITPFAGVGAAS